MAVDVLKQFIPGIKEHGIVSDATFTLTGTVNLSGSTFTAPTSQILTSPVITTGLTASGSASNDFSASTGTFKTSTGANTLSGDVTVAADKDLLFATGDGKADFSLGTGIFKTSTGAATIGTGALSVTASSTAFTNAVTGSTVSLTGGDTLKSATAVPATAGAVAAGVPITMYSTSITVEVTSDAPTHIRPKGSLCINTGGSSTSTRLYVNTDGSTGWASITTAS